MPLLTAPLVALALAASGGSPPPAQAPRVAAEPSAVYHGRRQQLHVRPPRLDEAGTTVDGLLDEPQWRQAALLTGFSQFAPVDGVPAEDSTEVLVWYSATAIHFGIRAFEPHGAVHATLAQRDQLGAEDQVQLLLGTFNDGRQATVFGVNPYGVQMDGTIVETHVTSGGFGSAQAARDAADLSPDYVFQSKGHLTDWGYEVEVRIPFRTLRYQSAAEQTWGINVVREVRHSGHEDSWAPARRGATSFLAQGGTLEGLTGLQRGRVLDLNPEITQRTDGSPADVARGQQGWQYRAARPGVGGNLRVGLTNEITLAATAHPDFSQVESDAGQLSYDPRSAISYPEKRPFFLEGSEQFLAPHNLIYTRSILQPDAAAKLTGKVSGTSVALLDAMDGTIASLDGRGHPLINLLRVQHDLGAQSKLGFTATDWEEGASHNRVAGADGIYTLGEGVSLSGVYAQSFTRLPGRDAQAPLWKAVANRTGTHLGALLSLDGISGDFLTKTGFVSRPNIVNALANTTFRRPGAPGALLETVELTPSWNYTWRYHDFTGGRDALEKKYHLDGHLQLRGGWQVGAGYYWESFGFDSSLYAAYRVLGAAGDTLPFRGSPHLPNHDRLLTVSTPEWARLSASAFVLWGRDENFYEWATADVWLLTYSLAMRPTDRMRMEASYVEQRYARVTDRSVVGDNRIPHLKVEYQATRALSVRVIGEFDSFAHDALRDDGGTGRPLLLPAAGGLLAPAAAAQSTTFAGSGLLAWQPEPGTVFFLGYGTQYLDERTRALPFDFPASLALRGMGRTADALFVKASYLWRL